MRWQSGGTAVTTAAAPAGAALRFSKEERGNWERE
jgi:hypothetical protein